VTLLRETKPVTGLGGTLQCVYGSAEIVYSAESEYAIILDRYKTFFGDLGWVSRLVTSHNNQEATVFYPPEDANLIVGVYQIESGPNTQFAVYFDFNECCEFCDDWRRRITRPHFAD
jgi:hypothetical protein